MLKGANTNYPHPVLHKLQMHEQNICSFFKSLRFGVICYVARVSETVSKLETKIFKGKTNEQDQGTRWQEKPVMTPRAKANTNSESS